MAIGENERDRLELLVEVASAIDLPRLGQVALDGLRHVHGIAGAAIFLRVGSGEARVPVLLQSFELPPAVSLAPSKTLPEGRSLARGEEELEHFLSECEPGLLDSAVELVLLLPGDAEIDGFVLLRGVPWGERRRLERLGGALNRGLVNSWRLARARRLSHERRVLLDLQRHITGSLRIDEVIERLLDSLADVVPYDAAAIFLLREGAKEFQPATARGFSDLGSVKLKTTQGIAGLALASGDAVAVSEVANESRYVEARASTRSAVAIPLTVTGVHIGVLVLESDSPAAYRREHREMLASVAAQAAVAIENARLHTTEVQAQALQRELKTARSIQRGLLPRNIPQPEGWEILGANFPSLEMSGDLYDVVERDRDLALVVGDVMGKGAPAAMLAATLHAAIRHGLQRERDLARVVAGANRLLCGARMAHARFSSLFVGLLDPANGAFEYVNAGHDPPIVVRHDGSHEQLDEGGLVLGVMPEALYETGRVELPPGSLLLLYTDGVTETRSPEGEEFGLDRLDALLGEEAKQKGRHLHQILRTLLSRLRRHRAGEHRHDDITLLGARRIRSQRPA
ncbi:MAG: hypothetical protein CME06_17845 [Gemmatimonadetes bacterium]|nr:hypothetical protein [Gemmatimonadota bacterium]